MHEWPVSELEVYQIKPGEGLWERKTFLITKQGLWNDLPPGLLQPGLAFESFRQSLKTDLFGNRSA